MFISGAHNSYIFGIIHLISGFPYGYYNSIVTVQQNMTTLCIFVIQAAAKESIMLWNRYTSRARADDSYYCGSKENNFK